MAFHYLSMVYISQVATVSTKRTEKTVVTSEEVPFQVLLLLYPQTNIHGLGITYWGKGQPQSIYLLGNRRTSGLWRKESTVHAFCLLPTEPVSIRQNSQWCQAPTQVSHVLWVWCRNYCRLIVQHRLPCLLCTTLYNCSEKVKMLLTDALTNYLPTIYLISANNGFVCIWRWTAFGHVLYILTPADQLMSVSDNTRNNWLSLQLPPTGVP